MKKSFLTTILSVTFFLMFFGASALKTEEACYNSDIVKDTSIKSMACAIVRNWEQHKASECDEKDDIITVKVKPKNSEHTERLQYFTESLIDKNEKISVVWEKLRAEILFIIKN